MVEAVEGAAAEVEEEVEGLEVEREAEVDVDVEAQMEVLRRELGSLDILLEGRGGDGQHQRSSWIALYCIASH